ncbi:MAG: sensor histidine kinase [Bacteroidota bacterium]
MNKLSKSTYFCLGISAVIFISDIFTPTGYAVWVLYLIPLLTAPYRMVSKSHINFITGVNTVLIWTGVFFEIDMSYPDVALFNRIIITFVLWAIAFIQTQKLRTLEEQLGKTMDILRNNQLRFERAEALAHVGSWVTEKDSGYLELSDEMNKILGLPEGVKTLSIRKYLEQIHADDRKRVTDTSETYHREDKTLDIEYRIVRPDGAVRYIHGISGPEFNEHGMAVRRYGAAKDITERKMVELERDKTLSELARSNRDLEQFAYVASHDLQEPLRMVSSFMNLLKSKYSEKLDEQARSYIDFAVDGSGRMMELIRDLLVYSRVSSRRKEFGKVDLNRLYENVVNDLQLLISETKAVITSGRLPQVYGDSTQIRQLLQNLIGNALKFHSDRKPIVNISAVTDHKFSLISVSDNGIGIDPNDFDRIFLIFQRLHDRDSYSGTGIGLAICKKIVEGHGGKIWVESGQGKGATFYFTLPSA